MKRFEGVQAQILESTKNSQLVGPPYLLIDTKTKELTIENSDFTESNFYNVELPKAIIENNNFHQSEFIQTLLYGLNFTTNNINGIKTDNQSLKGIQVNQFQAIELASLLGIDIVE